MNEFAPYCQICGHGCRNTKKGGLHGKVKKYHVSKEDAWKVRNQYKEGEGDVFICGRCHSIHIPSLKPIQ